jgi:hypothetical protein
MGTRKELKVGDLVRVPGKSVAWWHAFNQGAVAEVLAVHGDDIADVKGFSPKCGFAIAQGVPTACLKLAKQAMLEREAIAMVRAGNYPKPRNKSALAERMRRIYQYKNRR